jgi:hypothetical protein
MINTARRRFGPYLCQVLTPEGMLKSEEELRTVFASAGVSLDRPIISSCGTGVTACVLALVSRLSSRKFFQFLGTRCRGSGSLHMCHSVE